MLLHIELAPDRIASGGMRRPQFELRRG